MITFLLVAIDQARRIALEGIGEARQLGDEGLRLSDELVEAGHRPRRVPQHRADVLLVRGGDVAHLAQIVEGLGQSRAVLVAGDAVELVGEGRQLLDEVRYAAEELLELRRLRSNDRIGLAASALTGGVSPLAPVICT